MITTNSNSDDVAQEYKPDLETCAQCNTTFNEGDGISGFDAENHRRSYDWNCAISIGVSVNDNGNLVWQQ